MLKTVHQDGTVYITVNERTRDISGMENLQAVEHN